MSPLDLFLFVVVVPAVAAALMVVLAGWAGRRMTDAGADRAAVAMALGAGAIAAQLGNARPAFPPIDVTDRIPWLVLAAVLLGTCESTRPSPAWARWENRLLLTVLVLGMILGPVLGTAWPARSELAKLGGLAVLVLVSSFNLEALAARRTLAALGPTVLVVTAGAGAALLLSGSVVLGRIGGGLAAALGVVWVLSWRRTRTDCTLSLSRGGVPVLIATVTALLVEGHVYSSLPRTATLLLAGAPLAGWIGFVAPVRRRAPWQSAVLTVVVALVPAAVAVGLALKAAPSYE